MEPLIKYLETRHLDNSFFYKVYWVLVDIDEYFFNLWYNKLRIAEKFSRNDCCPWQEQIKEYGEPYHSRF